MSRFIIVLLASLLSACATKDQERLKEAAITPLSDLNLTQTEIPPLLLTARSTPYRVPAEGGCEAVAAEIWELDAILGPDLDAQTPAPEASPDLIELSAEEVKREAVGAVRRTAQDLIPFRGWVRRLSGAERRSEEVNAAINAGKARRAFLKGLRVSQGCGRESEENG